MYHHPHPDREYARQIVRHRRTQAQRRKLIDRGVAESCPRCHRERAIDTHELVRRSQYPGAAADLEIMVPVGRQCHDWIGHHPTQAHDEGWASWSWELNDAERLHEAELARTAASCGITWSQLDMVCDMTTQRVLVGLPEDLVEQIDVMAEDEYRSRSAMLRVLVDEAVAARLGGAEPAPAASGVDVRATVNTPAPDPGRGANPVTGRAYGPVPK